MLRSSRVLSGEPYRHPVGRMRAQEVIAARLSQRAPSVTAVPIPPRHWISESSASHSVRSSARIAAQNTVATYMADGSVIRIPRGVPATVTVRYRVPSTYDHITKLHDLLDATSAPDIDAETKQRRIYDSYRYVEQHGHHFLSRHAPLRSIIVDKAREIRSQMSKCVLRGAERRRFLGVLRRVEELFGDN
jgi:hypothetical protein